MLQSAARSKARLEDTAILRRGTPSKPRSADPRRSVPKRNRGRAVCEHRTGRSPRWEFTRRVIERGRGGRRKDPADRSSRARAVSKRAPEEEPATSTSERRPRGTSRRVGMVGRLAQPLARPLLRHRTFGGFQRADAAPGRGRSCRRPGRSAREARSEDRLRMAHAAARRGRAFRTSACRSKA